MPSIGPEHSDGTLLRGSRTALAPISPSDYDFIYRLASDPRISTRWRFGGLQPSPSAFEQVLWQNSDLGFIARSVETGEPVGVVQLINLNLRHGHAGLSFVLTPETARSGWSFQAVALFVRYVFRILPLRKLYVESLAPVTNDYRSAFGPFLVEEGRLRNHEWFDGAYEDVVMSALYRDAVEAQKDRIDRLCGG